MSDAPGDTDIEPLDDRTVERIAAGEVVERPASAVKELVENSIDADASTVDVRIEGDGTDLLRVRDDGHGMTETDVRAAVREHTTSKIGDIEDLERGVATLGFRGEALHTIGAVSRLAIETKPRGATAAGTRLEYHGGDIEGVEPVGCPEGTTVAVRDLFYNTPARRKYLKREATEFAHVSRVVSRYALANPDVAVTLEHDDRRTFATNGEGDLQAAIMSVYGREVAEAMVPVVGGDRPNVARDLDPLSPPGAELAVDPSPSAESPIEGITGYVSHPETTRSSTDYVSVFVDGRYVRSATVRDAVVDAYGGQLAADRYPFAVLFLSTEPGSVDVNVHPRKTEVRFEAEDTVRRDVRDAVRAALLDHGLVRSSAPRGRSAPDEASVAPSSGDRDGDETEGAGSGDGPARRGDPSGSATAADDRREREERHGRDQDARDGDRPDQPGDDRDRPRRRSRPAAAGGRSRADRDHAASTRADGSVTASEPTATDAETEASPGRQTATDAASTADGERAARSRDGESDPPADGDGRRFEAPAEQRTLGGERAAPEHEGGRLPAMRVLGQLDDTYVVATTDDGLVLVDQHAADERVNYERLRARLADPDRQRLAEPVSLPVTAGEAAAADGAREALERLGFEVELAGDADGQRDRHVRVTAVPAVVDAAAGPDLLREVLSDVIEGSDPADSVEAAVDAVLADLACYPSVTGNTSLTEGRVTDLLAALEDCENPYACPHGRPTVLRIDRGEIEDRFERDYPGHG